MKNSNHQQINSRKGIYRKLKYRAKSFSYQMNIAKLTEVYLHFQFKRYDKLMLDKKTHLIKASKARSSKYKYRWRTHMKAREDRNTRICRKLVEAWKVK